MEDVIQRHIEGAFVSRTDLEETIKDTFPGPVSMEGLGVHYRKIHGTAEPGRSMSIVDTVSPPDPGPPCHMAWITHIADRCTLTFTDPGFNVDKEDITQ
ncbi:MAG: hypothetical protein V7695_16725 [Sulfitobacter sp.]